jgi:hypothetical protein
MLAEHEIARDRREHRLEREDECGVGGGEDLLRAKADREGVVYSRPIV